MQPVSTRGIDLQSVRAAIEPALVTRGVVLDDLEWAGGRAGWVLRVVIDRKDATEADGGVTLADCADVSREISTILDAKDPIAQRYTLEVSSPGLDRPLRKRSDFDRFVGKLARVKLVRPASDGQRLLRGVLDAAPEGRVAVRVDGKRIEVDFGDIAAASLVFELEAGPKKRGRAAGARRAEGARGAGGRERPGPRSSRKV